MEVKEKNDNRCICMMEFPYGWNIGISSVMPNVMMAFVIIHALKIYVFWIF